MHRFSFHLRYLLGHCDWYGQGFAHIAVNRAETQRFRSMGQPQSIFQRSFLHGLMPSFQQYFLWDYSGLVHRFAQPSSKPFEVPLQKLRHSLCVLFFVRMFSSFSARVAPPLAWLCF